MIRLQEITIGTKVKPQLSAYFIEVIGFIHFVPFPIEMSTRTLRITIESRIHMWYYVMKFNTKKFPRVPRLSNNRSGPRGSTRLNIVYTRRDKSPGDYRRQ